MEKDIYVTPLSGRYASEEMNKIWSSDTKYSTWRKLWIALAETEKELGINITDEQIKEMKQNIENIDYDIVAKREAECRHDVMSHVYEFRNKMSECKANNTLRSNILLCNRQYRRNFNEGSSKTSKTKTNFSNKQPKKLCIKK